MDNFKTASNIKWLCKSKNYPVKTMLEDCRNNKNFIYDLKHKNSAPSIDKIKRIADYLDVSIDFLLGRDAQTLSPLAPKGYNKLTPIQKEGIEHLIEMFITKN